jgi:hypothetical protein
MAASALNGSILSRLACRQRSSVWRDIRDAGATRAQSNILANGLVNATSYAIGRPSTTVSIVVRP